MTVKVTVGELVARVLEAHGVNDVFGLISIHNLPIADAIGRRNKIRFVCSRGEAGCVNMADAYARFKGLGVAITSTGAGSGNAIGSLVEACNAGSPVIHITGQVEKEYLDRDASFIHEAADQLGYLKSSSKAAFRIVSPEHAVGMLREAIRVATTVPKGPVSIEIPIDVQAATIDLPSDLSYVGAMALPKSPEQAVLFVAEQIKSASRPIVWIGGGCLEASEEVKALADMGIPIVSSTHARGVLPDTHPRSLNAFHNSSAVEELIAQSDACFVVGSRLRSNETKTYSLPFPENLIQIDASPMAQQRNYAVKHFFCAEAKTFLRAVIQELQGTDKTDSDYDERIKAAKEFAIDALETQLGPYAKLCYSLRDALPEDGILVRDITMSGSTWGSRLFPVNQPLKNIHSLAGAIGLGLAHGIGTAIANPDKKTVALVGDGGLMLGVGEIATAVQENVNMVLMVMNDGGYGVMRGIQKQYFDGRQYYNELHTPSFVALGEAMGCTSYLASSLEEFDTTIKEAMKQEGMCLVEVNMNAIGPLNFAGPPQKKLY
ncbi:MULTISPECIES: thiamine pyrophosphate-binding protein [unclassified Psychrobacter]|uniref:thiamine pyrophosphate-binding protein n=1 Tax=unclassified Psychrobacter TaxID=196806 RepID=UPI0018F52E47|nr:MULTISPECIES: thiamine pyrophosphate-binding protein [unclassified Psychrobacter]